MRFGRSFPIKALILWQRIVGSATNVLLNSLVSYWKMDETGTGTRVDSHSTNDLINVNAATNGTGKINNGTNFVAASNQYLTHVDNASLKRGGKDWSISAWVYLASTPTYSYFIACKADSVDTEFNLLIGDNLVVYFYGYNTPSTFGVAYSLGFPVSTLAWHLIIARYVEATKTLYVSIDNGAEFSGVMAGSMVTSNAAFYVGQSGFALARPMDGIIDEVGLWDRSLDASDRSLLWNGGTGLPYSSFVTGLLVRLIARLTGTRQTVNRANTY